jgi:hypothetical protein
LLVFFALLALVLRIFVFPKTEFNAITGVVPNRRRAAAMPDITPRFIFGREPKIQKSLFDAFFNPGAGRSRSEKSFRF